MTFTLRNRYTAERPAREHAFGRELAGEHSFASAGATGGLRVGEGSGSRGALPIISLQQRRGAGAPGPFPNFSLHHGGTDGHD